MAANTASPSASFPRDAVRWGLAELNFELCSTDPGILAKAATIFRPWVSEHGRAPICRWHVESAADGLSSQRKVWEVRLGENPDVLYRGSVEGIVAMVEHLALVALRDRSDAWPDLHGAVVSKNGNGVIIIGAGESGKSTMACALWQAGWSLLGDDLTLVEIGRRMAHPVPRRVSLRHTSRPLLSEALVTRILAAPSCDVAADSCVFHPDEVDGHDRPAASAIDAIFFLGRKNRAVGGSELLQRIEPAQALLALLPYSSRPRRLDLGAALQLFKPLVESVPAYDLARGPLPDMVACVERAIRQERQI